VTTLDRLAQALEAGADVVLLDSMDVATLRKAVAMTGGRALLEAPVGWRWRVWLLSPRPGSI
jgi:nicotinate-nucleotide pyrophosphorylase (carboxylating)